MRRTQKEEMMANKFVNSVNYGFTDPADAADAKATASQFGTVKPSDDYSQTGEAAHGLVASQKALHDAAYGLEEELSCPYSSSKMYFQGFPGMVAIQGDIYLTSAFTEVSEPVTLGTLPAAMKPAHAVNFQIFVDHAAKMLLTINTSGVVKILNDSAQTVASGKTLRVNGCYATATA